MSDPFESQIPSAAPVLTTSTADAVDLDEIPIEIISFSDSFIESLIAPIHPTPPSIDRLRHLFQDFYASSSVEIERYLRPTSKPHDASALPPSQGAFSLVRRLTSRPSSASPLQNSLDPDGASEPLLTTQELADKKQVQRQTKLKQARLEEAVERRICEGIYDKIYQHHTTQDAALDDKLRSRTAALALVGTSLNDLGLSFSESSGETTSHGKTPDIQQSLKPAHDHIIKMHDCRYPLGKLDHLKAVHASIVDTLSQFHPSSSADEILPMLIYTLITTPPDSLHVVSDLHFIQNFRWEARLTGEASYCLTNLEAAIGFLETVDLYTLGANELPSEPIEKDNTSHVPSLMVTSDNMPKTSPVAVLASRPAPLSRSASAATLESSNRLHTTTPKPKPIHVPTLTDLTPPSLAAIGVAAEIFTTADQGLKNISTSLGKSYKLFVDRLQEPLLSGQGITAPRTLEEARQLFNPKPSPSDIVVDPKLANLAKPTLSRKSSSLEERMAEIMANKSRNSPVGKPESLKDKTPSAPQSAAPMLDSVRNFGSSLNPMSRLSGISTIGNIGQGIGSSIGNIGSFRGFGRATHDSPALPLHHNTVNDSGLVHGDSSTKAFPDMATNIPPGDINNGTGKISPPIQRFMEIQNPGDMRLAEVFDLLQDYRRLALALQERDAFTS